MCITMLYKFILVYSNVCDIWMCMLPSLSSSSCRITSMDKIRISSMYMIESTYTCDVHIDGLRVTVCIQICFMNTYWCVSADQSLCMHLHTYVCESVFVYKHVHICVYVLKRVCVYKYVASIHISVWVQICLCVHTYVYESICLQIMLY